MVLDRLDRLPSSWYVSQENVQIFRHVIAEYMIAMSEVTARQLEELVAVSFTCNTVYKDHPFFG